MKAANLAGAVLGAILKVAFAVIVVYLVYTGASTCYDYGYRIFTEPATEIGNTLQEKRSGKRWQTVCITVSAIRV